MPLLTSETPAAAAGMPTHAAGEAADAEAAAERRRRRDRADDDAADSAGR